jgi:hypothetical protein
MCRRIGLYFAMAVMFCSWGIAQDDATKKLGVMLGKWESEATFPGGARKVTSSYECRWSPQKDALVCESQMAGAAGTSRLVYAYERQTGAYVCTTYPASGAGPQTGTGNISGDTWTFSSTSETNGKTTRIRSTKQFSLPDRQYTTVESSDDGVNWKVVYTGTAHKVGN